MAWYDFFKIFAYSRRQDPISRKEDEDIQGIGITQPDIPDIRAGSWSDQYSPLNLSVDGTDFIDQSSVTNRLNRYKEYDRLQNIAEIENALTTFADEACISGDTLIATPFGYYTIKDLSESKKPEDRFLVYCWDFTKEDFTLGWAYNPRLVKEEETIELVFHDGKKLRCTKDHLCLKSNFQWVKAQDIKEDDEIISFHRIPANQNINKEKMNQFPRILSTKQGWMHERQFIDQWKTGKKDLKFKKINQASKLIHGGLNFSETERVMQDHHRNLKQKLKVKGFTFRELKWLSDNFRETRRVIGIHEKGKIPVYDLSVEKHENFATDSVIVHNCQTDEDGHIFKIKVKNEHVKEEVEMLLHNILEMDDKLWGDAKTLYKYGDLFWEIILDIENPKDGVQKVVRLPADSMFRIETIKGKLIEFQQSKTGPDYNALTKIDPLDSNAPDLDQSNCIRFHKDQVIHMRIGDDRKTFYPYGVSALEAARGPAHQLMLMEDCMLTYRLIRAPERRVFYVDVGTLAPFKAEAYIERIKDQFRKKKTFNKRSALGGSSAVEERYVPPSVEEDFWIPIRPNSQTKIETLAGASNLSDTDDALWFRQKLYVALQFPRNYLSNTDPQANKLTVSQNDTRFARMIERLQMPLARGLKEIVIRHLKLRGYPEEDFFDLQIKLTPPSDWRRINRNEVEEVKFNRAATMKGTQLMSDFDILTTIMDLEEDKAKEMVARNKAQKIDDFKLQAIAQNPSLLFGPPPETVGTSMGTSPGGPNPELSPDNMSPEGQMPQEGMPEGKGEEENQQIEPGHIDKIQSVGNLPEPTEDEIKKYGLEIQDYKQGFDDEEIDDGELGGGV